MPENAASLRYRSIWQAVAFCLVAAVIALSLLPVPVDTEIPENGDKLGHLLAYGSLMFWFAMLHSSPQRQLAIAAAFCAMGVMLEFLQGMTGYRSYELADMAANCTGVLIGWALARTPLKHSLAWIEAKVLRRGVP